MDFWETASEDLSMCIEDECDGAQESHELLGALARVHLARDLSFKNECLVTSIPIRMFGPQRRHVVNICHASAARRFYTVCLVRVFTRCVAWIVL